MNSEKTYAILEGKEMIREADLKDHVHEIIVLPSSIRMIEEGSFAYGKEPMQIRFSDNPYFSFQNHFLIEKKSRKLITYADHQAVIHVPENLSAISQWAFWECHADQIIFPDEIPEIHENALTTCEIQEAVFSFCNAHVFFPRHDIRLRQYLLESFGHDGMFDFARYDDGIAAGFTEPERIREITARLKWPYHLEHTMADDYRKILTENLREAVRQLGNSNDTQTIRWLCDLGIIDSVHQEEVLQVLHNLEDLHAYMDLSRYLHETGQKEIYDFSI